MGPQLRCLLEIRCLLHVGEELHIHVLFPLVLAKTPRGMHHVDLCLRDSRVRLRLDLWLPQNYSKKTELEWEPSLQWVLELDHLAGAVLSVLPEAVLSGLPGTFQSPDGATWS